VTTARQVPAKRALVVGGGDGGVLRELARHQSLQVTLGTMLLPMTLMRNAGVGNQHLSLYLLYPCTVVGYGYQHGVISLILNPAGALAVSVLISSTGCHWRQHGQQ
jgi:hypothetical protein